MPHPDFHTNQTFGLAAARAFGLDPDRVSVARVDTADLDKILTITFEVALKPEDLARIGQEMARIDGEEIDAAVKANAALVELQDETQGVGERTVQHLDTGDEPEPVGLPPHVWLYRNMLTDLQRLAPLGIDETNGQYAVAVDQLTDAQRQVPHIARQLDEQNNDL